MAAVGLGTRLWHCTSLMCLITRPRPSVREACATVTHPGQLAQVCVVLDLLLQRLAAPDRKLPPLGLLIIPPPVLLHGASWQVTLGMPAVQCCHSPEQP